MIGIIRVIRGFIGFFTVVMSLQTLQAAALIPTHPDTGAILAIVLVKSIVVALLSAGFYGLYLLVNRLYSRKQDPTPKKLETIWKL